MGAHANAARSNPKAVLVLHRRLEEEIEEALRDYVRIEALLIRELRERFTPGAADVYRWDGDAVPRTNESA